MLCCSGRKARYWYHSNRASIKGRMERKDERGEVGMVDQRRGAARGPLLSLISTAQYSFMYCISFAS